MSNYHFPLDEMKCALQGFILGPLLFIIYINNLPNCTTNFDFTMYADDTNILSKGKYLNTLNNINIEIRKVITRFTANKLHLNAKKSVCEFFHHHNKNNKRFRHRFSGLLNTCSPFYKMPWCNFSYCTLMDY